MVSTAKKLPAHGTVQRYRLELKTEGGPCDRCKRANADKRVRDRATASARARREAMHVVEDVDQTATPPTTDPLEPGPVEVAVRADIDAIPEDQRVRFHSSFEQVAIAAARDMDHGSSVAVRAAGRRDLFEAQKQLMAREVPNGHRALDAATSDFGAPLPGLPDVSA